MRTYFYYAFRWHCHYPELSSLKFKGGPPTLDWGWGWTHWAERAKIMLQPTQWRNFKFWGPPHGNQLGPPLHCPADPAYHCNLPPQHQHFRVHANCCVKKFLPEILGPLGPRPPRIAGSAGSLFTPLPVSLITRKLYIINMAVCSWTPGYHLRRCSWCK